jgi:uncharacterized UPF0160 family protein
VAKAVSRTQGGLTTIITVSEVKWLVTHSGGFHADEVMASVILTKLFPAAEIRRTRETDWITPADDRVIYDVGGAYDAAAGIFDHHQRGAPLRGDGQPFSSFGLIWHHFGRDYLSLSAIPAGEIEHVHAAFDRSFVLPVDLIDNGAISPSSAGVLARLTLPVLLETLKPAFDELDPEADTRAFLAALSIARSFIEAAIAGHAAKIRADSLVREAIARARHGRVLELPAGMPFRKTIEKVGADHLLFVVHPRKTDWCVSGIGVNEGDFTLRADLPASWAGLTDIALEAVTGVKGAIFCHNARFIAAAATRDAAMSLAGLAVASVEVGSG